MNQPPAHSPTDSSAHSALSSDPPRSQPHSEAEFPAPIIISQRHLSLFEQCPRRYQAEILDRRSLPISDHQRHALQRGQQFHHLLQQRALGINSQLHDPQLDRWLDRLQNSTTLLPDADPSQYYQAEHPRTLSLPPFELLVRYDALIADRDRADIIDWKTYARPKQPQKLAQSWQTRLYRYVLAATSDYPPECIAMIYWFAEPTPGDPQAESQTPNPGHRRTASDRVTLPYDMQQFKQDHREIMNLLDRLHTCLDTSASSATPAPSPFPTRLDLGHDCDRDHCACVQLQLLGEEAAEPAIRISEISDIEEVAP